MGQKTAKNSQKEGKPEASPVDRQNLAERPPRITKKTPWGGRTSDLGGRPPGQFSASTFYELIVRQTQPNDRQTSLMQKRQCFNFVSRWEIRSNHLGYKYIMFWTKKESFTHRETPQEPRTPREGFALQRGDGDRFACESHLSFL